MNKFGKPSLNLSQWMPDWRYCTDLLAFINFCVSGVDTYTTQWTNLMHIFFCQYGQACEICVALICCFARDLIYQVSIRYSEIFNLDIASIFYFKIKCIRTLCVSGTSDALRLNRSGSNFDNSHLLTISLANSFIDGWAKRITGLGISLGVNCSLI